MRVALAGLVAMMGLAVGACSPAESPGGSILATTVTTTPAPSPTTSPSVAPPHATFVMPDVTGMYWVDVEPLLRAQGWTGVLLRGPDVLNSDFPRNTIAVQNPIAGQVVGANATITVQFAS